MWRHGKVNVNGELIETSWKTANGAVTAIDLPRATKPDARIMIDGVTYVRENLRSEDHGDRITIPLITTAEMERRIAEIEDAKAKALADFEGRPWPPVKVDAKPSGKAKPGGE